MMRKALVISIIAVTISQSGAFLLDTGDDWEL
jgi:hypothetical protein